MTTHGTRSGYQWHIWEGTPPCADCKRANTAYFRKYRAEHPSALDRQVIQAKRRDMALRELAQRHEQEFNQILWGIERVEVARRASRGDAA